MASNKFEISTTPETPVFTIEQPTMTQEINLTFHSPTAAGGECGKFWWDPDAKEFKFEGNAADSAKILAEYVSKWFESHMEKTYLRELRLLEKENAYLHALLKDERGEDDV